MNGTITATHADWTTALREAGKAARRPYLPVLSCALVAPAVDGDGFTIQSTDLEVWTHDPGAQPVQAPHLPGRRGQRGQRAAPGDDRPGGPMSRTVRAVALARAVLSALFPSRAERLAQAGAVELIRAEVWPANREHLRPTR